jgi:thiol-disulfide isomerase/thioredoxin
MMIEELNQMITLSCWKKLRMFVVVGIAAGVCAMGVCVPLLQAQERPSIVGSAPLFGLSGGTGWINSPALTAKQLKGKVVLVDFWDYSCINCIRAIPYVRAWAEKYKDSGFVVIGVHTPEFDVEKQVPNVQKAVTKFGITYPVVLDNNQSVWDAFHNQAWPAHYFIDAKGKVRYEHFGEGEYDQSERWIQELLKEANGTSASPSAVKVDGQGVQASADFRDVRSPETYIGYARAERFSSPGGIKRDTDQFYSRPTSLHLNEWGLMGNWTNHKQVAVLTSARGEIVFRFHARDLHLVLGSIADGRPVRFHVTIDGQVPGENHGEDTDTQGNGVVKEHRLYQLVRQRGLVTDRTLAIEFEDPGVQAFSFTFG